MLDLLYLLVFAALIGLSLAMVHAFDRIGR